MSKILLFHMDRWSSSVSMPKKLQVFVSEKVHLKNVEMYPVFCFGPNIPKLVSLEFP